MAKAKKSESTEKSAKTPAPKTAAKSKSPSKPGPSGPGSQPLINTTFAASAAAKMLASGLKSSAGSAGGLKSESAMFKQLKANVSKPHATGLDNFLDKSAPASSKKSTVPFSGPGGNKQVGHNQTHGADVTRSGVPRRTAG